MERKDTITVVLLVLAFVLIFFVRYFALFDSCTWNVCPDKGNEMGISSLIKWYPNFYEPAGCFFGIAGETCHGPRFSIELFVIELIVFALVLIVVWRVRKHTT